MSNLQILAAEWELAKAEESEAIERRRKAEDEFVKALNVPKDLSTTMTADAGQYVVKIVGRIDRKVDADKLQEIAAESGLTDHLSSLFRWKPEVNAAAWKSADESITKPLLGAITSKAGRPSFSITIKE